ncbi:hypothetical protein [Paraburkholderia dipogonis]|uniref:hypothetical protein n=1 Tax=Paraburkholderia dipogonis TaxID=1211383 RepID=UPI0038B8FBDD
MEGSSRNRRRFGSTAARGSRAIQARDLAEIVRKSQMTATTSLTERANEHAAEIKQMLQRK